MKNQNVLFALFGIVAGYFLLTNKSISLPALKAKEDIVDKAYSEYYGDATSRTNTPFGKQHEITIAESQNIGTVGGGLADIWGAIKTWKNKKDYEKQLGELKTAEEIDLYYEA